MSEDHTSRPGEDNLINNPRIWDYHTCLTAAADMLTPDERRLLEERDELFDHLKTKNPEALNNDELYEHLTNQSYEQVPGSQEALNHLFQIADRLRDSYDSTDPKSS